MDNAILPLEFSQVSYQSGQHQLLHQLNFSLGSKGSSFILGPNGAGKSLTLRLAHGLLKPSAGTVRWCGEQAKQAANYQAMVLQHPVLLRRSVWANVEYPLKLRGMAVAQRRYAVQQALERVGLFEHAALPARSLSGGERQRLALARAWVVQPEVLLLDEPTASLDPAASRLVEKIIDDVRHSGVKVIMTCHDLGQARRLADEVLFLHNGRLLEQTPAVEFFQQPRSMEAQAFLRGELLW